MPEIRPRQSSFAAGELSPGLWGRTDMSQYHSGFREATNFLVTPWGTLANRSGTLKIDAINLRGGTVCRAVPFVFSDTDSVVLVFVNNHFYVYAYDSTLGYVAETASMYSPYAAAEINSLVFSQVGDIITITSPSRGAYELSRLTSDNTSWQFNIITYAREPFDSNLGNPVLDASTVASAGADGAITEPGRQWQWALTRVMQDPDGKLYETGYWVVPYQATILADFWHSNYHYVAGDKVWLENKPGYWYEAIVEQGPGFGGSHEPTEGTTDAYWTAYAGTTQPYDSLQVIPDTIAVYQNTPVRIFYGRVPVALADTEPTIFATRIYRGREGMFGLIGETKHTSWYIDEGADPDFSRPPPEGEHPFEVRNAVTGDLVRTEYPQVCAHYEGRRVFAGTSQRPTRMWLSATESYSDFDMVIQALDNYALTFELASSKYEAIRAIIPRQWLIVFTDNSEWLVTGSGQGAILTPTSIAARPLSEYGCSSLYPLVLNDAIMWIQRKGTVPRAVAMSPEGTLQNFDVSALSRHLFIDHTIDAWAYAEDPWSIVWAVRDDYTVLACTFNRAHQMIAWTKHEIAGADAILSVASLPEGKEDAVYFIVQRGTGYYLERLTTRVVTDVKEGVFVDGAVTYDGRNTDTAVTAQIDNVGGENTENNECQLTMVGESVAGENVGNIIRVHVGEEYCTVTADTHSGGGVYVATLKSALPDDVDGTASAVWSVCKTTFDGLAHLVGETCIALLDGQVYDEFTLTADQFTPFANPDPPYEPYYDQAFEVGCIGAQYDADYESLDAPNEKGRKKNVKAITVETEGSRGGLVGEDLDRLHEIKVRQTEYDYGPIPLENYEHRELTSSRWAEHGRIAYRQASPLPVTILGLMREIELGG